MASTGSAASAAGSAALSKPIDVDVVRAVLASQPGMGFCDLNQFAAALSPDEQARADKYKIDGARDVFTLARGLLRFELAMRLACEPRDIHFDVRPSGKPDLRTIHPGQPSRPDWRFSVSHTGRHVAIAFALGVDVGIDIEDADRAINPLEIAKRYFADRETRALAALVEGERPRAFFAGWTRKEAIVKARGSTMSGSLKTLNVEIDPAAREPRFEDAGAPPDRRPCRLASFEVAHDRLIGAVAILSSARPQLRFCVRTQQEVRLAFDCL